MYNVRNAALCVHLVDIKDESHNQTKFYISISLSHNLIVPILILFGTNNLLILETLEKKQELAIKLQNSQKWLFYIFNFLWSDRCLKKAWKFIQLFWFRVPSPLAEKKVQSWAKKVVSFVDNQTTNSQSDCKDQQYSQKRGKKEGILVFRYLYVNWRANRIKPFLRSDLRGRIQSLGDVEI